jgi:hypothetical protein
MMINENPIQMGIVYFAHMFHLREFRIISGCVLMEGKGMWQNG